MSKQRPKPNPTRPAVLGHRPARLPRTVTVCADCRFRSTGYVRRPPGGRPGSHLFSTDICLAQPHDPGITDPISGRSDWPANATACSEVNNGSCPDFQRDRVDLAAVVVTHSLWVIGAIIWAVWLVRTCGVAP